MEYGKTKYIVSKPESFDDNLKYPTVIFMHGAGTRGDNVENVCLNPFFCEANILRTQAIIYAPLCNQDSWFDMFESIREFAHDVWTFVYQNPEPFRWLLGCRKEKAINKASNSFHSSDLYG